MFALNAQQNLFAAIVSIGISAVLFATAIVPASPNLMV
ncbi:MAG: enoyl-CoA hydratase [Pseudomonadota bacterium]